jgi:fumarate reductase flavoprotein subunit
MSGGAEIVTRLEAAARERGVSIVTSTKAIRLILQNGRVAGLAAERDNNAISCKARRAVVLASGGFTRNGDMIRNFGRPGAEKILPLTGQGSRGDGIRMGMGVGSGISYMTPGVAPTAPTDPETGKGVMVLYSGAIALNSHGARFCRESDLYIDTCWAALAQPGAAFVQIYDRRMRKDYALTMMGKVLTGYREIEADSIGELARMLEVAHGFNGDGVVAAVARYNDHVRSGHDSDFGRTNLVGTSGALMAIENGPFYAALCRPGTTHFNGGLTVDTEMAVRNVFGEPIPGLYAAGETTGGFHGIGYMSGTFVGMALIFGRVAGRSAAAAAARPA